PFGEMLLATTERGICHAAFADSLQDALTALRSEFPGADIREETHDRLKALHIDGDGFSFESPLRLHVKGSAFQLKVWEALLRVPSGNTLTYGRLAEQCGNEKAGRAVGSAVGKNPVA